MDYRERVQLWSEKLAADDPLRVELVGLSGNDAELQERFIADMTFGTAGLRGKIGVGTMRMNYITVGRATQGLADYISSFGEEAKRRGVVIAHDPRHFSKEFSRFAAGIFAANGIRAYVFPELRPTPELSYLIPVLGAISGVNLTASHNPRDFNGYKVYWEDGCQVSAEVADGILACIERTDYFDGIRSADFAAALADGRITMLGAAEDRRYLDEVESLAIHSGEELDLSIPLVYTPLNGAASIPFREMLRDRGFSSWHIVAEQENPDPDFTTVGYPNPEDPKAFRLAEELGRRVGAELLMATDPDGDRFAIEILGDDGRYIPLNGNQTGVLLANYILEGRKDAGTLPAKGAMVKSIVTSTMTTEIARAYGVEMFEALTGFKNICGRIPELTARGYRYLLGYEESIGYAASPNVRDKDGISAGMLIAEAAAYYRKQGKTLWQVLEGLYKRYGWFAEEGVSLVLEGLAGAERIQRMMIQLRKDLPTEIAGVKVAKVIDYQQGYQDIPASNVLRFFLEDGGWFAIRPSGTEPKIKFYFYTKQDSREAALAANRKIRESVLSLVNAIA